MSGKAWMVVILFLISLFIGVVIYDNYESIQWAQLQHKGLANNNTSAPQIIPHIPYQFANIIMLIVVMIIMVGIFVGIYEHITD